MLSSSSAASKRGRAIGAVNVCDADARSSSTRTTVVPASRYSATFARTFGQRSLGERTSTIRSGGNVQVSVGQRAFGNAGVTVEGDVGASHGVGTAFGNHTGVVAEHATHVVFVDVHTEYSDSLCYKSRHVAAWASASARSFLERAPRDSRGQAERRIVRRSARRAGQRCRRHGGAAPSFFDRLNYSIARLAIQVRSRAFDPRSGERGVRS